MSILWSKKKSNIKISIITEIINTGSFKYLLFYRLLLFKKYFKLLLSIKSPKYSGHFAVTRSLIEGLEKIKYNYNYNPISIDYLSNNVVVLSNVNAVNQMIQLKKNGFINKLFIGPNVISSPIKFKNFTSPYIDGVIVPSEPVKILTISTYPYLINKCFIWPAGVDKDIWSKIINKNRKKILLFIKDIKYKKKLVEEIKILFNKLNINYELLIYGDFTQNDLFLQLEKSFLMVCLSRIESQGILYAESWCADVPTFIYYNFEPTFYGIKYNGNSAPYLNEYNGKFFQNINELEKLILDLINGKVTFAPRKWCLNHMTDEKCAENILEIINSDNEYQRKVN
jgi:hypothetical protein